MKLEAASDVLSEAAFLQDISLLFGCADKPDSPLPPETKCHLYQTKAYLSAKRWQKGGKNVFNGGKKCIKKRKEKERKLNNISPLPPKGGDCQKGLQNNAVIINLLYGCDEKPLRTSYKNR